MRLTSAIVAALVLSGCETIDDSWFVEDPEEKTSLQMYSQTNAAHGNQSFLGHQDANKLGHWARDPHSYLASYHNNINSQANLSVSDYVESMAIKLIKNMQYVTPQTPVAIASFVPVDSSLEETNLLGLHLAENFLHEAQQLGLSVIDYKATGTIRVTEKGDFSLSRDVDELRQWHPIEYVLTGTFTQSERGIEVHARMVGIESRAVVASAQATIPHAVAEQLRHFNKKDGISLTKG